MRDIDKKWALLNDDYGIVHQVEENGICEISANQINAAQRWHPELKFEARLLVKFDSEAQQPKLFTDYGLSIMPVTRGTYVIGLFRPFVQVKAPEKVETVKIPQRVNLESLQPNLLFNEGMSLNYADAQGAISDFVGEEVTATAVSRMSSGDWSYKLRSGKGRFVSLDVHQSQIEIDAGYESASNVILFEAKNKLVEEFNLRQLYFPYRSWRNRVRKDVRTVFAAFDKADAYFYEYEFPDPEVFEGRLLRARRYVVEPDEITKREVAALFHSTEIGPEPEITFPQADSATRVIDVIDSVVSASESGVLVDAQYIKELYGFRRRQGNYYADAAAYLGYLDVDRANRNVYLPNGAGIRFSQLSRRERDLDFCKALFSKPIFHRAFLDYFALNTVPTLHQIELYIHYMRPEYSRVTEHRRAQTVKAWIEWVISLWSE